MADRHLVGLIGSGIGRSLSPALHEAEADRFGVRYFYQRLDLDVLRLPADRTDELITAARLSGYTGLNITHPCKQVVIPHLDSLSPEADRLGAVNTVVLAGGTSVGHNTDLSGFTHSMRRGLPDVSLDEVVLLGAGGAGAAVAHALIGMGVTKLWLYDEDPARAVDLGSRVGGVALDSSDLADALSSADGLVHATPTGMAAHPGMPVPRELLRPGLWVADIVYRPLDTELVRTARELGCRVLDGGMMAVFQAVDSFRLFTGLDPDPERMLRHFAALVAADSTGRTRAHH